MDFGVIMAIIIFIIFIIIIGYFVGYKFWCKYYNFNRWIRFNLNTYIEGCNQLKGNIQGKIMDNSLKSDTKELKTIIDVGVGFMSVAQNHGRVRPPMHAHPGFVNLNHEIANIMDAMTANKKLTTEEREKKLEIINKARKHLTTINTIISGYEHPGESDTQRNKNNEDLKEALKQVGELEKLLTIDLLC